MPYFIYKIDKRANNIERLDSFTSFKEAKTKVREIRASLEDDTITAKIIFADNPEEAESRLKEKRTPPILKEWEK